MRVRLHHMIPAAAFVLMTASASASDLLGPGTYVYIDTSVREVTLDGMEQRLAALENDADASELRAVQSATSNEIEAIYRDWGVDSARHARYGMRHAEAIDQWLADNPAWARSFEELRRRHDRLSRAIDQLMR